MSTLDQTGERSTFAERLLAVGRSVKHSGGAAAGRLFHPIYRRRAVRSIEEGAAFDSVVFVCQGNIFRSPFAEQLFLKLLPPRLAAGLTVSSAGFVGPGRACPKPAIALASERGVELAAHRSSSIRRNRIGGSTLVVVMGPRQEAAIRMVSNAGQILVLGDLDPAPATSRTIEDPWSESEEVLHRTYDRVERCVKELVWLLVERRSTVAGARRNRR
ncbi:MAG: hypothetical protein GEU90_12100 [Gemmatimonas sp.]|nr:hypothetical protein [Gemmatimonas sp.]